MAYVVSSGEVSSGIILSSNSMAVLDGGTADNTTVNSGGSFYVSSGGTANSATINAYGSMFVSSSGVANITTVNSGGRLHVSSGGTANDITVSDWGQLYVNSGGTANDTALNGGHLGVDSGGEANSTTINSSGYLLVFSGGTANNTTVDSGWLYISSGGRADNTTVNTDLGAFVFSGGTAVKTTVNRGKLTISSGGTATGIVENGGYVNVYAGAVASFESNSFSGLTLDIDTRSATVHSGTTAADITVNAGARFHIYSGGTATGIVENGGYVSVASDASVTFVSNSFFGLALAPHNNQSATVHSGTTANATIVNATGYFFISSGGIADDIKVSSGGSIRVNSGGTATGIAADSGAILYLTLAQGTDIAGTFAGSAFEFKNALVSGYQVNSGGWINVISGGRADGATVNATGSMYVKSLGAASDVTVRENGTLFVSSGGIATAVSLENGASASIGISGTLNGVTADGGSVEVLSGGSLTGRMAFKNGAAVAMEEGSVLDFDISGLDGTEKDPLVSGFQFVGGSPDLVLTVSAEQAMGTYLLADGAGGSDRAITVKNTSGTTLGSLTTEKPAVFNNSDYSLKFSGGALTLTVSEHDPIAPTVTNVAADITTLTNQDVTVTAEFADNVAIASSLYKLGETGAWTAYAGGVTVTQNTTVYFKAVDLSGNESEIVGYTVSNIDKTPPAKPAAAVASSSINEVFVSAVFSDDSAEKEYSLDARNWNQYASSIKLTDNGIVYFRGIDAAGNISEIASHAVSNFIDGYVVTSSGYIVNGSSMSIREGEVHCGARVNSYGTLLVSSGGVANSTTVNSRGYLYVYSGGEANSTTINSSGYLLVSSGGVATNTTVSSGALYVFSGGTATNATVNSGGNLYVFSGGTATNIVWTPCKGHVYVSDGGYATFASKYSGVYFGSGNKLLSSATAMDGKTLNYAYEMYVMNGGVATNATVNDWGRLYVSSGGVADSATVSSSGYLCVSSGGTANGATVSSSGYLYVSSGGMANNTTVSSGALYVFSGGTANDVTVKSGGYVGVGDAEYEYGGSNESATVNHITVNSGGALEVCSGGTVTDLTCVPIEAEIHIYRGAQVTFAGMEQYSGVYLGSGGELVSSAATMTSKTIVDDYDDYGAGDGNEMWVMSGGTAIDTTLLPHGKMYILSGGVADCTLISGGSDDEVGWYGGSMYVFSGGVANSTTVNGGFLVANQGGVANKTIVNSDGRIEVMSEGVANSATVFGGGSLTVNSGGVASNTKVYAAGTVKLTSGAKTTGKMNFAAGAVIFVDRGAIVDFDLTQTEAGGKALLTDWSLLQGRPDYTLTIDDKQEYGVYILADGAEDFEGVISVRTASGTQAGALTVGQSVAFNGSDYTLNLDDEALTLTVSGSAPDTVAPTVSGIAADITALTNQDVTVTAVFEDNYGVTTNYCRIGERGEWIVCMDGATVTENATVYFKAVDPAGNESEVVSYTVSNIDKVKPTVSDIAADITAPTRKAVTVTAAFADDIGIASSFYRIGDGEWMNYTDGVRVSENAAVYFKTVDTAGNESEIASCEVTNIEAPSEVISGLVLGEDESAIASYGQLYKDVTINDGGVLNVSSGGMIRNATVNSYGTLSVSSGGEADGIALNRDGSLYVDSGGTATGIAWTPCEGHIYIDSGAQVTFAEEYSGVYLGSEGELVSSAATMTSKTLGEDFDCDGTDMCVMSGGTANNTMVSGDLYVYSGGTANNTMVSGDGEESGRLIVSSGGTANNTMVNGYFNVDFDGTANSTTVNSFGYLRVDSGAVANVTTIYGRMYYDDDEGDAVRTFGEMRVCSGGTATDVTLHDGILAVESGGVVSGLAGSNTSAYSEEGYYYYDDGPGIWRNYPAVHVSTVGKLTGRMTFNDKTKVYVSNGAILDFDLTRTSAGAAALVNDFSAIVGSPYYSLTVDGTQENGTYRLADGVQIFYGVLAVVNTSGVQLGTLAVGQTTLINGTDYTLNIADGSLSVTLKATGAAPADTEAPTVTDVAADITGPTNRNVTVTASFDDNVGVTQSLYRIGDGEWTEYTDGVTVNENTTVYFKAVDAAGNESEVVSYEVTNIIKDDPAPPEEEGVFGPDTRNDGWLYDKKTKKLNENVTDSAPVEITSETGEILFDEAGSVSHEEKGKTWQNFVGKGKVDNEAVVDDADFVKISLDNPAKLSFSVEATNATKFTVYSLVAGTDKNGNATHTMKALQTTALKKDKSTGLYSTTTKALLLERTEDDRDYYISMQSTNKKAESVFYNVSLVTEGDKASRFYADADEGDNNWLYDKKTKKRNETVVESDAAHVNSGTVAVQIDAEGTGLDEWGNFVGFGDNADHAKITLDHAARLRFTINAADAAKFVIYSLTPGKNDTYTMKALQTTALKKVDSAKYEVTTKNLLLAAGDYYVSVQSTNAKKGGGAYYNVTLNQESIFFSDGDNGDNNWLYDKKAKIKNDDGNFEEIVLEEGTSGIQLDTDTPSDTDGNGWSNYVGYGDDTDFAKLTVFDTAKVSFSLKASAAAKFTIYTLIPGLDKKQDIVYTMKALQTTSLKKVGTQYEADTKTILLTGGVYYISVQSTNAKKGVKAFYNVTATCESINPVKKALSSQDMDALVGPDTVASTALDAWNSSPVDYGSTQDELFAGLDDVQDASLSSADSSLNSASEKFFEESGNGLLASL